MAEKCIHSEQQCREKKSKSRSRLINSLVFVVKNAISEIKTFNEFYELWANFCAYPLKLSIRTSEKVELIIMKNWLQKQGSELKFHLENSRLFPVRLWMHQFNMCHILYSVQYCITQSFSCQLSQLKLYIAMFWVMRISVNYKTQHLKSVKLHCHQVNMVEFHTKCIYTYSKT